MGDDQWDNGVSDHATAATGAFDAAPGSSLRVHVPGRTPARRNRSPRPWRATTGTVGARVVRRGTGAGGSALPPERPSAAHRLVIVVPVAGHRVARPVAPGPSGDRRGAGRCLPGPATGRAADTRCCATASPSAGRRTPRTTSSCVGGQARDKRARVRPQRSSTGTIASTRSRVACRGRPAFRFLRHRPARCRTSTARPGAARELQLDDTDQTTQIDHWLVVGDSSFHVTAIADHHADRAQGRDRRASADEEPVGQRPVHARRRAELGALAPVETADAGRWCTWSRPREGDVVRFADGDPRRRVVGGDSLSRAGGGGGWDRRGRRHRPRQRRRCSATRPWGSGRCERSSAATTTRSCRGSSSTGTGGAGSRAGSSTGPGSWRRSGTISFRVPATLSATEIGGREDLWIRARLVGGDYGRPKYVVTSTTVGTTVTQSTSIDTSDLHPPEIESIEARFDLDGRDGAGERPGRRQPGRARPDPGQRCRPGALPPVRGRPRHRPRSRRPAVYVGLSRPAGEPAGAPRRGRRPARPGHPRGRRAHRWRAGVAPPSTTRPRRSTARGLVQVSLSTPLARAARFGREGFWLRLRPATDQRRARPPGRGGRWCAACS